MKRRDVDYIVIALMLASGLYVTLTGLIADLFGLHQVILHSEAGYICAGSIVVHIALNGRSGIVYLRQLFGFSPGADLGREPQTGTGSAVGRRAVLTAALSAAGGFIVGWLIPDRRQDLPGDAKDIGALYHAWSTPGRSLNLPVPDWGGRPPQYKTYPDADRVELPEPDGAGDLSVSEAIDTRRSVRYYGDRPLSMAGLSCLLHAAQGITEQRLGFRAAPSAGALYPIELYAVVHRVSDLPSGIYHYAVRAHELESVQIGDFRGDVTRAGLHQSFLGHAAVCFLLSVVFQRSRWKYRERAYRYALLEAGHIAQNLYLAATSMGLGACAVGAFYDEEFNALLGLDPREEALVYVISVGDGA